jgi:hypothetical protein
MLTSLLKEIIGDGIESNKPFKDEGILRKFQKVI